MELIGTYDLTSNQATVTFSSIPNTYEHLYLVARVRSTANGYRDDMALKVNSLSSGYAAPILRSFEGALQAVSGPSTLCGYWSVAGATNSAEIYSVFEIKFFNYSGSQSTKMWHINSTMANPSSYSDFTQMNCRNTSISAAINRIDLYSGNGQNWQSGSQFSLYGINASSDGITTVS